MKTISKIIENLMYRDYKSAISFLKILLCPEIHCMVICILSPLILNKRGSRPLDFPSRATHRDWESVNIATEEFYGTPVCNHYPPGPSLLPRRNM